MAYVITKGCLGVKDRSCVEVCPVDCIYNIKKVSLNTRFGIDPKTEMDPGMLVIHPDQCISCGACEPECPQSAIFDETAVPQELEEFRSLNEEETKIPDDELDSIRCTSKDMV